MYGSSWDRGRFMKDFRFDTICNSTQEPQDLQKFNCACEFIKYHQLLSKNYEYKYWQEIEFRSVQTFKKKSTLTFDFFSKISYHFS